MQKHQKLFNIVAIICFSLLSGNCNKSVDPSPGDTVNMAGQYVITDKIASNNCSLLIVNDISVSIVEFIQSGDTVSIINIQTGEVRFTGTVSGNSYNIPGSDTISTGNCIILLSYSNTGTCNNNQLSGTLTSIFDTNEDPTCSMSDCQITSHYTGEKAIPPAIYVTGTWIGTMSTSLIQSADITLNLTQDNTSITGTYNSSSGGGGEVAGAVSANKIYFVLKQTGGCPGIFSGVATITNNSMSFTFSGEDCLGTHNNGQGNVTIQ